MSNDIRLYERGDEMAYGRWLDSMPLEKSNMNSFLKEIDKQKEQKKNINKSKNSKIMKYNTSMGKITAQEMDDRHLHNRIRFEINLLSEAKSILSTEEEIPISKWDKLQNDSANRMTEDRAVTVLEDADAKLAFLILEATIRGLEVKEYGLALDKIYDRKEKAPAENTKLFKALPPATPKMT